MKSDFKTEKPEFSMMFRIWQVIFSLVIKLETFCVSYLKNIKTNKQTNKQKNKQTNKQNKAKQNKTKQKTKQKQNKKPAPPPKKKNQIFDYVILFNNITNKFEWNLTVTVCVFKSIVMSFRSWLNMKKMKK